MKRIIAFAIAALLLLSIVVPAFARQNAVTTEQQKAGETLKRLGIYKGYVDGSLGLENTITRAEFSAVVIRTLGIEQSKMASPSILKFRDIPKGYWGEREVATVFSLGLMRGYDQNTFAPNDKMTYAQITAVMIRMLGYESSITGPWPTGPVQAAQVLGLVGDVNPNDEVTRGQIAEIITKSLLVEIKR